MNHNGEIPGTNGQPGAEAGDRSILEGRLKYSPVLGHLQGDDRWVARLANTVETTDGELVTIELRGDRAEVGERAMTVGCWLRASGRWSGHRFDIDRFDIDGEQPDQNRRYRLSETTPSSAAPVPPTRRSAPFSTNGRDRQPDTAPPAWASRPPRQPSRPDTGATDRSAEEEEEPSPPEERQLARVHRRRPGVDGAIRL